METFGILDFLKPLLTLSQKQETFSPQETEKNAPTDPPVSQNSIVETEDTERAQTAYLSFLQAHENRAKRIKK